jgi:integrase
MKDKSLKSLVVKPRSPYSPASEVRTMRQTGIKKLSNGRYKARYFAGYDSQGKRRYPALTFDTQGDAIKWRTAQVAAKHSGRHTETHGLTVSQFLDQWLAMKAQTLRENSLAMYQNYVTAYIKPHVGSIRLARLRPTQVETMQAELLKDVSGSTAGLARVILNGAMKKAVRLRLIPINPVEGTDPPKRNKSIRYALTVEEALKFLEACETSKFGLAMVFALHTGLRPEELLGLCWPDLELDGRGVVHVWRVMHQLRGGGGGWRWHEPKSKSGKRSVVFPSHIAVKLIDHRRQQLERKMRMGQHWQSNELVFCSSLGTPIKICALQQEFKSTLKRAKLPASLRLYDLRHSFVTFSLVAGVDAKTVSYEAGHSDVGFTLQTYGSVLTEMRESASDKREELFKNRAANK